MLNANRQHMGQTMVHSPNKRLHLNRFHSITTLSTPTLLKLYKTLDPNPTPLPLPIPSRTSRTNRLRRRRHLQHRTPKNNRPMPPLMILDPIHMRCFAALAIDAFGSCESGEVGHADALPVGGGGVEGCGAGGEGEW